MFTDDKNKKKDKLDATKKIAEKQAIAGVQEGTAAPLGSIAKSSSPCGVLASIRENRRKRFSLLSSIRDSYIREGKARGLLIPTSYHRTSLCKHAMTGQEVLLNQCPDPSDKNRKKGFFTGLQTCGSVWTCPVCANRIQEQRRQEIAQAMTYFYKAKKQAVMVTFTFPHTASDGLKDLLSKFSKALVQMRAGKAWQGFKARQGFEGLIRSLEVTRGGNGWHPHTHELWFVDSELDELAFKTFVLERWLKVCIKAGLVDADDIDKQDAFITHSLDFKFNCSTSDYLAKYDDKANWGVDRELAKASSKKGKAGGMHPFELAFRGYQSLWIEYTEAIKGKAQLFWSTGLKALVGIDDVSDEEASENENNDELVKFVGALPKESWHMVTSNELRAQVLEMVEDDADIIKIRTFIATYKRE